VGSQKQEDSKAGVAVMEVGAKALGDMGSVAGAVAVKELESAA
jgi:hypothetical protein